MAERVIVVTGAFGVLGRAVCAAAAARGLKVAALDYAPPPDGFAAAFAQGGVDLTNADAAQGAIDTVARQLGGVDALANIAGGFAWQPVAGGDPSLWDKMFLINLKTAANAARAAIPHLKASPAGRIVNVGANAALKGGAGMGPYTASKAGVHRLTEALAEELKETNVCVNAVLPSVLDTPANRADMPGADPKKWVAPADLAAVILFLASEEARAVTGALLPVTGRV
ncbi:MAG: SDR family NAD(P)-dependent oxidoreductase [Hydrogenophilaceae bacterium]|jgi:NAD(P)-dependent dehydrogenase (short-subunit alcohol dehydrogenase family)|nr:SDR family NAD(P)-dependent oxidoreductase [Hydrogenophilaceae bacterium]